MKNYPPKKNSSKPEVPQICPRMPCSLPLAEIQNFTIIIPFITKTFIDYQGYTKFDTTDKEQEEGTIRCLLHFCFSTCVREIPLAPLLLPCVLQCVCRPSSGTMVLVLASTAQRDLGGNLPPTIPPPCSRGAAPATPRFPPTIAWILLKLMYFSQRSDFLNLNYHQSLRAKRIVVMFNSSRIW